MDVKKYLQDTIDRLEKIVRGFEKKHGDRTEIIAMLDIKNAIASLQTIITKYK